MKNANNIEEIKSRINTKNGQMMAKFAKVVGPLFRGYKVRMMWSGTGYHRVLVDSHYRYACELVRICGLDSEEGNDAPRGGMNGNYVRLTEKGVEQAKSLAVALGIDIKKY